MCFRQVTAAWRHWRKLKTSPPNHWPVLPTRSALWPIVCWVCWTLRPISFVKWNLPSTWLVRWASSTPSLSELLLNQNLLLDSTWSQWAEAVRSELGKIMKRWEGVMHISPNSAVAVSSLSCWVPVKMNKELNNGTDVVSGLCWIFTVLLCLLVL